MLFLNVFPASGGYSLESFKVIPLFSYQGWLLLSQRQLPYITTFFTVCQQLFLFIFVALRTLNVCPYRNQLEHLTTYFQCCQYFFYFFLSAMSQSGSSERRRRDLNPRAAINDLHPFQGCPFGQLGYFSAVAE